MIVGYLDRPLIALIGLTIGSGARHQQGIAACIGNGTWVGNWNIARHGAVVFLLGATTPCRWLTVGHRTAEAGRESIRGRSTAGRPTRDGFDEVFFFGTDQVELAAVLFY